jgi:hypothetical protein
MWKSGARLHLAEASNRYLLSLASRVSLAAAWAADAGDAVHRVPAPTTELEAFRIARSVRYLFRFRNHRYTATADDVLLPYLSIA